MAKGGALMHNRTSFSLGCITGGFRSRRVLVAIGDERPVGRREESRAMAALVGGVALGGFLK